MRARLMTLGWMLALTTATASGPGCTKAAPDLGIGSSESALISGRAVDSEKGEPLANAIVTISTDDTTTDDDKTTTTDRDGYFEIRGEAGKTTIVTVEKETHAKAVRAVAVQDAGAYVEVLSKEVGRDQTLNGQSGGMVKVGNERTGELIVLVPADALETRDGEKYTGQITIEVATVRPDKASDVAAFPGTFDGKTLGGDQGTIETRSAALLRVLTASGEELKLSPGATIEMFMPVPLGLSRRAVPFWRLDQGKADWTQTDAPAVRDVDPISNSQPALRSAVRALTWWNAGEPIAKSRITGCVQAVDGDAMRTMAGVQVIASGLGYGYRVERLTDADGCFELEVKAQSAVSIFAQTRSLRTQPLRLVAPNANQSIELDMLTLSERSDDCPGAMQECNGECVDLLNSNSHCGACGVSCQAEAISSEYPSLVTVHCVYDAENDASTCGCDVNQAACDTGCANIETDAWHCGACNNACDDDQECVDATCVAITCRSGQYVCNGLCIDSSAPCTPSVEPVCDNGVTRYTCPDIANTTAGDMGFSNCCAADGTCGINAGNDQLSSTCASTFFGVPANTVCPDEDLEAFGAPGHGCCRPDGECGLIVEGLEELGCMLRHDVFIELPAQACGGGTRNDAGTDTGDAGAPLDASAGESGAGGIGGGAGGIGGGAGGIGGGAGGTGGSSGMSASLDGGL